MYCNLDYSYIQINFIHIMQQNISLCFKRYPQVRHKIFPCVSGDMMAPAPPPRKEPADWESRFSFKTTIPQPDPYMPMPKTYPSKDATIRGKVTFRYYLKIFYLDLFQCSDLNLHILDD